jgi:TolB protein
MHSPARIGFVVVVLMALTGRGSAAPYFSPTGVDIVFTSERGGNADIWLLAADATDAVNLTRHPAVDDSPEWSPDGKRIVFSSARNGSRDVFVMNADGKGLAPLTTNALDDHLPVWFPDGRSILFQSLRDEDGDTVSTWNAYRMRADGSDQRPVLATPLVMSSKGSFSPDGTEIVFSRVVRAPDPDAPETSEVVTVKLASGEGRVILAASVNGSGPVFSPDGQWIAFVVARDSTTVSIEVVRGDGTGRRAIVSKGKNVDPRWSPDGRWLLYSAEVPAGRGSFDVRTVEVESGEVVPLITGKASDRDGRWRP